MANKKRLIDANALLAEMDKFANPMPNESGHDFLCGIATAITEIEDAPIVDAMEVVRCKDCKCAYINSFSAASGVAVCKHWSNEAKTVIVQQDDFCSYGERREGNERKDHKVD